MRAAANPPQINGFATSVNTQEHDWLPSPAANRIGRSVSEAIDGAAHAQRPRLRTCVYTIVVLTSARPSNSCIVRLE